ncbi:hypothetical protein BB561_005686 [Smittium simulii]|uniref:GYF domain-containing protein n=1 Tax=Smittium simulii TaxID=133385 RepID=A0A2T9Y8Z5_9FUNG|nr:hypothetical protein BB561_005686 [Smittium simulii]
MASHLNFGPEWMRGTSNKISDNSESASISINKQNLTDSSKIFFAKKYTFEEMVSLYNEDSVALPECFQNRADLVLSKIPLLPLAKIEISEQELQKFSGSQQRMIASQRKISDFTKNSDFAAVIAAVDRASSRSTKDASNGAPWSSAEVRRGNVGSFGVDGSFRAAEDSFEPSFNSLSPTKLAELELLRKQSLNSEEALLKLLEIPIWYYRDPKGALQGLFSGINMQEWFEAGYFPKDLNVRRIDWRSFETLSTIVQQLLHTSEPFIVATLLEFNIDASHSQPSQRNIDSNTFDNSSNNLNSMNHINNDSLINGEVISNNPNLFDNSSNRNADVSNMSHNQIVAARSIQLAQILSEQEKILLEINDRQQIIQLMQQQAQQQLLQIGNSLAHQQQQISQQSHSTNATITQEYLSRLQHECRVAEESIRVELIQQTKIHMLHLDQLESSLDPIVIDAVQRGGIPYAITLIRQQLKQLQSHMLFENQGVQQLQQNYSDSGFNIHDDDLSSLHNQLSNQSLLDFNGNAIYSSNQELNEAQLELNINSQSGSNNTASADPAIKSLNIVQKLENLGISDIQYEDNTSPSLQDDIDTISKKDKITDEENKQKLKTASKSKVNQKTDDNIDHTENRQKVNDVSSQTKSNESNDVTTSKSLSNKKPLKVDTTTKDGNDEKNSSKSTISQDNQQEKNTIETPTVSSPWLIPTPVPKKTLSEIQREESLLQAQQRTNSPAPSKTVKSYASLVGSSKSQNATNTPKLSEKANIKEDNLSKNKTETKDKNAEKSSNPSKLKEQNPSPAFLEWCRSALGSLTGINVDEFIQMLLSLPVDLPQSDYEIISDQVYAYSKSLNGKSFATDFVKRRKEDLLSKKPQMKINLKNEFSVVQKKGKKSKA